MKARDKFDTYKKGQRHNKKERGEPRKKKKKKKTKRERVGQSMKGRENARKNETKKNGAKRE